MGPCAAAWLYGSLGGAFVGVVVGAILAFRFGSFLVRVDPSDPWSRY